MTTTILANSKPIREPLSTRQYVCKRCGIIRSNGSRNERANYCVDCIPEAVRFGWIPTPKTWDRKKKSGAK